MAVSNMISIIMGIYNNESTLAEALDSILAQTYTDWQMIMCDDCSADNTYKIANKYVNKYPDKFILIKNDKNLGLNQTLNHCLEYATGEYIARMDGDDISLPTRFEREIMLFEQFSDIDIVSTDMSFFDENGVWGSTNVKLKPENNDFLYSSPFCHAACLVKREAYTAVKGYSVDKKLLRVEDYHLWIKMYEKGFRGMNIQEPLYQMRDDRNAIKRRKFKYRLNEVYVKFFAVKHLKLPIYGYIYGIRPLLLGLLPTCIYTMLHRVKNSR